MASFTETQFPSYLSQGSSGGATFSTDIMVVSSGFEERKIKWSEERNRYDALHQNLTPAEFEEILDFFKAMRGRAYGFRFKDWGDYNSCGIGGTVAETDQRIGVGDGATLTYQLIKTYTSGFTYTRNITKPVPGTVLIAIDGLSVPNKFSIDTTTGIITFPDETFTVTDAVDQGGSVTRITTSVAHGYVTGDALYLSGFTGDWAGLNGNRFSITLVGVSSFDIAFDSSLYAAYSGNAGFTDTLPQTGEAITAGYEFDVPVRFDSDEMITSFDNFQNYGFSLPIIEIKV